MLIVSDNWLAGLVRTQVIARIAAFALGRERIQRFAFGVVSQTGIHYRESPLSETRLGLPDGAPRAGDRFPWLQLKFQTGGPVEDLFRKLDDTRFNLLVFGQPGPDGAERRQEDWLRTHVIPVDPANDRELARAGISGPACFLLRPDGHIGLAGGRLDADAVNRYFAESHMHLESKDPGAAANRLPVV